MKAFLSVVLLPAFGAGVWGEYTPEEIAVAEWKESAEKGEAEAQFELGEGERVRKDQMPLQR